MKTFDIIRRGGRNLRQSKIRTLLTALALAVGGFTLTLTLAASNGAREFTDRLVSENFDAQSLIIAKDKSLFEGGGIAQAPQEYDESLVTVGGTGGFRFKQLLASDVAKIEAIPGVQDVLIPYNTEIQNLQGPNGKRFTGSAEAYNPYQSRKFAAGQLNGELPSGQVVLPDTYVNLLGYGSAAQAIGKNITLRFQQGIGGPVRELQYIVAAVTTKPQTQIDAATANIILLARADAESANNFVTNSTAADNKLLTISAHVAGDAAALEATKQEVIKAGYVAQSVADTQEFIGQIIDVLQIIILVFGAITLVASFFGVVNTQYISVLERTREIGLMKALGMSRGAVSRLFMIEATWIGFIGAVLGSALAFAVGTALNPTIARQIDFGDNYLLVFDWRQIGLLVLFLMLVTTVAGLLPARKAAKLDPIEALRTE